MFKKNIFSIAVTCVIAISTNNAFAETSHITVNGANACMPRLFDNLGDYKSSNGGLRNDTTKDRNIVCQVPILKADQIGAQSFTDIDVGISADGHAEDFICTLQARDVNGNSVADSTMITVPASSQGYYSRLGNLDPGVLYWTTNVFVQCKIPGGTRILSITAWAEY